MSPRSAVAASMSVLTTRVRGGLGDCCAGRRGRAPLGGEGMVNEGGRPPRGAPAPARAGVRAYERVSANQASWANARYWASEALLVSTKSARFPRPLFQMP